MRTISWVQHVQNTRKFYYYTFIVDDHIITMSDADDFLSSTCSTYKEILLLYLHCWWSHYNNERCQRFLEFNMFNIQGHSITITIRVLSGPETFQLFYNLWSLFMIYMMLDDRLYLSWVDCVFKGDIHRHEFFSGNSWFQEISTVKFHKFFNFHSVLRWFL